MEFRCGEQTGRTTRKGDLCRLLLKGGKCPTHDCNLSLRNSRVARNALEKPSRRKDIVKAARLGFAATQRKYGRDFAIQKLAKRMRSNPSGPEQVVIDALNAMCIDYGSQEIIELGGKFYIADFVGRASKWIIEVDDGWRDRPNAATAFGRDGSVDPEAELEEKMLALHHAGYDTLRVVVNGHPGEAINKIKSFLADKELPL